MIIGTTSTLVYFYYGAAAGRGLGRLTAGIRRAWGGVGRWFILATLGAIFANMTVARLTLLVERIRFLLERVGLLGL
jgi:hypothetical protein